MQVLVILGITVVVALALTFIELPPDRQPQHRALSRRLEARRARRARRDHDAELDVWIAVVQLFNGNAGGRR